MIKSEIKEEVSFVCDNCNKAYKNKFISFDMINDIQMRIFEHKPQTINNHYTYWRRTLDFCKIECWLAYLNTDMKMFLKEITSGKSKR